MARCKHSNQIKPPFPSRARIGASGYTIQPNNHPSYFSSATRPKPTNSGTKTSSTTNSGHSPKSNPVSPKPADDLTLAGRWIFEGDTARFNLLNEFCSGVRFFVAAKQGCFGEMGSFSLGGMFILNGLN